MVNDSENNDEGADHIKFKERAGLWTCVFVCKI